MRSAALRTRLLNRCRNATPRFASPVRYRTSSTEVDLISGSKSVIPCCKSTNSPNRWKRWNNWILKIHGSASVEREVESSSYDSWSTTCPEHTLPPSCIRSIKVAARFSWLSASLSSIASRSNASARAPSPSSLRFPSRARCTASTWKVCQDDRRGGQQVHSDTS